MNVSMQDSYNLGWKLALVLRGFARPSLLKTYQSERRAVAVELIKFDQHFSRLFSRLSVSEDSDASDASMQAFRQAFIDQKVFSAGFAVNYENSTIVAKSHARARDDEPERETEDCPKRQRTPLSKQHLAINAPLGKRFPSFKVVNHSDARPWHFNHWLRADGHFYIVLFAGDVSIPEQMQRVRNFCDKLEHDDSSFLNLQLHTGADGDAFKARSYLNILTIHSAPRTLVELADFPELLHPFDQHNGWDYEKIFVDGESYYEPHGEAYAGYGVDKQRGCVLVVRPDQYIGWIGELEDVQDLEAYFLGFLNVE